MHPLAERFRRTLIELGEDGAVQETPDRAHTAAEAAAALGVPVETIVKSLVFTLTAPGAEPTPLLVLASGSNRVDVSRLGDVLGGRVGKADAATVKEATGYSIGGVPPLGHPRPLRTLVDEALLRHELLWAAAGTATAVFPITPDRLVELTGGEVVGVA
ncbi:YbaK/EbsC family protein [Naasia sp. SYSU D00948]|uniref:YbaK/EbsC family protein n=1 Tax=Naasia sp. SYSU D00948 TaxID=2817379 RepID=UPI001B30332E|nr:YbaK/EbsC family protein [Naasia sp. SYSU D00948]